MSKKKPKDGDGKKRVPLPSKVRPDVLSVIEALAKEDDRPRSNMVERLLCESPRVKARLPEPAAV